MVNIAIVGAGYWGKNLVRNFYQIADANLLYVCDKDEGILKKVKKNYPNVKVTPDLDAVIGNDEIEAVVVSTPAVTHYEIAKKVLAGGKNVFVEKPLSLNNEEGSELIEIADKKGLILMVGHLLRYHPAVKRLKEIINDGTLGKVFYLYSQRLNLGIIRKNENALWSFAPHDISISLNIFDEEPEQVVVRGASFIQSGIEDVVFCTLIFSNQKIANIHVSWLDPHKVRRLTVVGGKKMVTFDDMEPSEKIKIYEKSAYTSKEYETYGDSITVYSGDVYIPKIDMTEPLKLECQHFAECVREKRKPLTDGEEGLRVLKVLNAAQTSLDKGGAVVECDS